ncbi:MAG: peptidoglycan DD-metalloendopeptidase family protein [Saprospiraceae bacterium]|nr:peptidoglycan DD-metalloendopeptidase family protein [Saprospiraceae bacterium]
MILLAALPCLNGLSAQSDKETLERQRSRLIEEIELTSRLVTSARQRSKATLSDVQLMETQLRKRRELVKVLDKELDELKLRSKKLQDSIRLLRTAINSGKEEYGLILNKAHIKARLDHPFQYLVNSASVFEGFQKWIYLRQLKRYILQKLEGLSRQSQKLTEQSDRLDELVGQQSENLRAAKANKEKLEEEARITREMLERLKKDVSALERKLESQRKERKRLNDAIEKLILAELEKNRRRRELNTLPEAEIAKLSREFENNRGRLPWPVRKGVITAHYGRQSHPDIRGVYLDNTGIDLVTDENAVVRAVFDGTVVGTTTITGHQNMIIINHGDYFTVYSKLATVEAVQGQEVRTGDPLGTTGRAHDGLGNFHFEIWKGKNKVNPELWITR